MSTAKDRKLLDEVRDVMRLLHYSIHTERTYCEWIRKYIHFHTMKSRDDLADGEKKIEAFLTHLAVHSNVAPATQNQAMNALVFLYRKVLKQDLDEKINAIRSSKKTNIPAVMTREETAKVLSLITGTHQVIGIPAKTMKHLFFDTRSRALIQLKCWEPQSRFFSLIGSQQRAAQFQSSRPSWTSTSSILVWAVSQRVYQRSRCLLQSSYSLLVRDQACSSL